MPNTYKKRHYGNKTRHAKKNKTTACYLGSESTRALLASIETMAEHRMALMTQLMNGITPNLIIKVRQYKDFINSVVTSYEYRRKNIPSVLLTILTQTNTVIERANHIIRFHNDPEFLQCELATNGYDIIVACIQSTIENMVKLEDGIRDYTQTALDDYKGRREAIDTQEAINTQHTIRNKTTRRTVALYISNFARALAAAIAATTERARALTRRTRS